MAAAREAAMPEPLEEYATSDGVQFFDIAAAPRVQVDLAPLLQRAG